MLRRIILSWVILSATAYAGPTTLDCQSSGSLDENLKLISEAVDNCPDPSDEDILKLCKQVAHMRMIEDEDGLEYYAYHDTLESISCAKGKPADEISHKVKVMWSKNGKRIKCNLVGYDLPDHNIVKYAVSMPFNTFLIDLIDTYKVDLNLKDPKDNKTPLEFCRNHAEKVARKTPPDNLEIKAVNDACNILSGKISENK